MGIFDAIKTSQQQILTTPMTTSIIHVFLVNDNSCNISLGQRCLPAIQRVFSEVQFINRSLKLNVVCVRKYNMML